MVHSRNDAGGAVDILRLFFSFYGRIGRAKYWAGWVGAYAVIGVAMAAWAFLPPSSTVSGVAGLISMMAVFTLIPICVKRLHDLDITGWWVLVFLGLYSFAVAGIRDQMATQIGSVILFIAVVWLGSTKGEAGGNRRGPAPA
jgi:uncharacterized membrane protein YhaH (DUF805 family)